MSRIYEDKKAAESYDSARVLPDHAISLLVEALKKYTPVGQISAVLDLGGGTGRFSSHLQSLYECPVYTLDPSGEMLKQGVSRGFSRVHWAISRAENIPLDKNSINLVFMSNVFHHLENREASLREIARVLTDKGFLVVRNGTRETDSKIYWLRFFPEAIKFDKDRIPGKQEIIGSASSNGFRFIANTVVYQQFASSYREYYDKISRRGLSSLLAISDEAFNAGCARFRNWVEKQPPDTPVFEPIDYFFFHKEESPGRG